MLEEYGVDSVKECHTHSQTTRFIEVPSDLKLRDPFLTYRLQRISNGLVSFASAPFTKICETDVRHLQDGDEILVVFKPHHIYTTPDT